MGLRGQDTVNLKLFVVAHEEVTHLDLLVSTMLVLRVRLSPPLLRSGVSICGCVH